MFVVQFYSLSLLDAYHYNVYINLLKRRGWGEEINHVVESMKKANVQMDIITYSSIVSAFSKTRQWSQAEAVFLEMQQVPKRSSP